MDVNLFELGRGFYIKCLQVLLKTRREAKYYLESNWDGLIGEDGADAEIEEVDVLIDDKRAWVVELKSPPLEWDDFHIQSDEDLKREKALQKLSYEEQVLLGLVKEGK